MHSAAAALLVPPATTVQPARPPCADPFLKPQAAAAAVAPTCSSHSSCRISPDGFPATDSSFSTVRLKLCSAASCFQADQW